MYTYPCGLERARRERWIGGIVCSSDAVSSAPAAETNTGDDGMDGRIPGGSNLHGRAWKRAEERMASVKCSERRRPPARPTVVGFCVYLLLPPESVR